METEIIRLINETAERAVKQYGAVVDAKMDGVKEQLKLVKIHLSEKIDVVNVRIDKTNTLITTQNSRVNKAEDRLQIIEAAKYTKAIDCPYREKIESIAAHTVAVKTIKNMMVKDE